MRIEPSALLALCLAALLAAGCSKEGPATSATTAAAATDPSGAKQGAAAGGAKKRASACELITAAEMSAILGGTVVGAPGSNDRPPTSTECDYSAPAGPSPQVEVQVDWNAGDVKTLDTATGLAQGAAPTGAVDPLQGLGDRAYTVTADQVFISTGGHLMMIRFPRQSTGVAAKARRIFETAQPRL